MYRVVEADPLAGTVNGLLTKESERYGLFGFHDEERVTLPDQALLLLVLMNVGRVSPIQIVSEIGFADKLKSWTGD